MKNKIQTIFSVVGFFNKAVYEKEKTVAFFFWPILLKFLLSPKITWG